jgi:tetratricopeptide (TPR) repeat protein
VPAAAAREGYNRAEVRRMLGLSERRLRSWEKQDLIPLLENYTFPDLVVLRTLARLTRNGVRPARIRRAVAALRQRLGSISDPLKELALWSEGGNILVQVGPSRMEAISGQLLLDFDQTELRKTLSFPKQTAQDAAKVAEAARRFDAARLFDEAVESESRGAPAADVIALYERAVALDPSSVGALVNLGTIYFHQKNWSQAEHYYRRALETDPQYALAHFNLGNLYDEQNDRARAFLHYAMALRLDPNYGDAHYNLALLCQSAGQVMRAVRHWKAYLRIDPSSPWAAVARQELEKLRRATVIEGAGSGRTGAGA